MSKSIKKLSGKLSIAMVSTLVVAMMMVFGGMIHVLAQDHQATQQASTARATAISIVGKAADTAVGTITFPEGAAGAVISDPYNNVDGDTDPQVLDGSSSEPVVRLKNTAGATLRVWLSIADWSNSIADSQHYELVATSTTNVDTVTTVLSSDGNAATVDTTETIDSDTYKALYLKLTLSSVAGKTGTSTLTILGESS